MEEKEKKFDEWWNMFSSFNTDALWSERQRMLAKIAWDAAWKEASSSEQRELQFTNGFVAEWLRGIDS